MKSEKKKNKSKEQSAEQRAEKTVPAMDHSEEIKRLNRIAGQVEGIRKMLESGRDLSDILIQFKAIHSALRAIEHRVFKNHVNDCIEGILSAEKRKEREERTEELMELFKQV